MIERIRITATGKNQLSNLKRKTGIDHYNVVCRHALCLSLGNASPAPHEDLTFAGGLEMDWRTFTGGQEAIYLNLLITRMVVEDQRITEESVRNFAITHLHRGLSYLSSAAVPDLLVHMASRLQPLTHQPR